MPNDSKIYDLAIIGGGIAGVAIARDASLRGWSVILLEKNTLGSGTSSKSSKLIHGGIRYLEIAWTRLKSLRLLSAYKNIRFVFSSLREARTLERLAPELIKPLPILIPIYKTDHRLPFMVFLGARVYYFLARLTGEARKPRALKTSAEVLKEVPNLNPQGLIGGILIWDRIVDDLSLVKRIGASSQKNGTQILEHTPVESYNQNSDGSFEIRTAQGSIRAKRLVNASGPWIDTLRKASPTNSLIEPVAGSHIELKPFTTMSVLLQAVDNRVFFVINRGARARVGTTERPNLNPDSVAPTSEEIDYLLKSLKQYFPSENFSREAILSQDAGVRPLAKTKSLMSHNHISREHVLTKDSEGVLHVAGVKLTDHRRAAEQVMKILDPTRKSQTAVESL